MRKMMSFVKLNRGNFLSNVFFLKKTKFLKKKIKILEIGSGKGIMAHYLTSQGYDVTATEVNDEYIKLAKIFFGLSLVKINTAKLPFKKNTFDLVLSFDVFEHIPNSDLHLKEVKRVLNTNGHYLFSTPNKLTNVPFSIIKDKSFTLWKTYHCSVKNYWELLNLLKNYFQEIKFLDIPSVNKFFVTKVMKTFGNIGKTLLKIINPDKFPLQFRTNFYVVAKK